MPSGRRRVRIPTRPAPQCLRASVAPYRCVLATDLEGYGLHDSIANDSVDAHGLDPDRSIGGINGVLKASCCAQDIVAALPWSVHGNSPRSDLRPRRCRLGLSVEPNGYFTALFVHPCRPCPSRIV